MRARKRGVWDMETDVLSRCAPHRVELIQRAAESLARARRTRLPIAPLSHSIPDLSEPEAYAIARLTMDMQGDAVAGYKLGYTSEAMRQQMGVSEPNFGFLLFKGEIGSGGTVPAGALIHPMVEPEIAFRMDRDLAGPNVGREDALGAVSSVMGALEIVDTRYTEYKFQAADNISDNSSATGFVLGEELAIHDAPSLADVIVRLERNGEEVESGAGSNALGDPALALAWLANKLFDMGSCMEAGQIILTGGLTRAHAAITGTNFVAKFDGLGDVEVQF